MTKILAHRLVSVLLLLFLSIPYVAASGDPPIVAAASDLQFALREIADRFQSATGQSIRLNFGSSGNFRRQITQGAPYEIYLSADEDYVFALHGEGHTVDRGQLYATGRIAIIAPEDNKQIVDATLQGLRKHLDDGQLRRFAIANPEHAPYGLAARQVLKSLDLWTAIEPNLILGENIAQAAQFALSGETDGGIVAYSLALAPPLRERSVHALIPAKYHQPLRQRMVLLKNAGETARRFYEYLQQEAARRIFKQYGFSLPEAHATHD